MAKPSYAPVTPTPTPRNSLGPSGGEKSPVGAGHRIYPPSPSYTPIGCIYTYTPTWEFLLLGIPLTLAGNTPSYYLGMLHLPLLGITPSGNTLFTLSGNAGNTRCWECVKIAIAGNRGILGHFCRQDACMAISEPSELCYACSHIPPLTPCWLTLTRGDTLVVTFKREVYPMCPIPPPPPTRIYVYTNRHGAKTVFEVVSVESYKGGYLYKLALIGLANFHRMRNVPLSERYPHNSGLWVIVESPDGTKSDPQTFNHWDWKEAKKLRNINYIGGNINV